MSQTPNPPQRGHPQPDPPSFARELGRVLFPGETVLDGDLLARLADTYDTTVRHIGPKPNSVLWHNRFNQVSRFKKLLLVLGPDARCRGLEINDLGCGYGALFHHVRRRRFLSGGRYTGYDLSAEMVGTARHLFRKDSRASFIQAAEATREADYSFASGTFGLCLDADAEQWGAYVRECLRRLAARSRRGMAFNMLDVRGPDNRTTLYYADPAEYLAFVREDLGARATVIDTYTPYDFTILCRFDGTAPPAGRDAPRRIRRWRDWLPFRG